MVRFYVGVDVAKARHEVAITDEQGNPKGKSLSIANSREGFDRLFAKLAELGQPADFHVGLEATGTYGWPLRYHLAARGYKVGVLSPLQTGAFARTRIRKTKTDPIDALGIANVVRYGKFSSAIIPTERALRLRELTRYRKSIVHLMTRLKGLLESRVYRIFPELDRHFINLSLPTPLGLLRKLPTPGEIAAASEDDLTEMLQKLSYGRSGAALAQAIQKDARETIGVPMAADVYGLQMRGIAGVLRILDAHVRGINRQIGRVLREEPEVLTSIPGMGDVCAATILGEIVDVRLFENPEKLVAFAGFDCATYSTGQFTAESRPMSKRGSPHLRAAVWHAAFIGSRFCPDLQTYYDRKVAQGKPRKAALGALCRKLLHLVWRLLTDNRRYEARTPKTADTGAAQQESY